MARTFLRLLHLPSAKKQKKCSRRKKIPQKFNMSLTSELSKVSPDYEIHCPTRTCHFWHSVWIFAIFWILPALWRFFANCAKFAISQICHNHQNRHSLRGLAIFRHFYQICHFRQNRHSPRSQFWHPIWIAITQAFFLPFFPFSPLLEILDVTQILLLIIDWYVLQLLVCYRIWHIIY